MKNLYREIILLLILPSLIILNLNSLFPPNRDMGIEEEFNTYDSKNENFLDIICLFKGKVPNSIYSEKALLTIYQNFPAAHLKFDTTEEKIAFYKNYSSQIAHSELNQQLIGYKNTIEENISSMKIISEHIRDLTFASYLHSQNIKGQRAKIGIVDTGVYSHPIELGERVKSREVFVNTINGYSEDIFSAEDAHGHGTHVAGLAAGTTTGIAPESEIYSAKIIHTFSVLGAGNGGGEETTAGVLSAIDFLVANSVDVINLSIGQYHNLNGGIRDEILNYISLMYNIVVTVSAGNSGTAFGDRGTLNNPGTSLQSISVAATNSDCNKIADFSSHGPKVDYSMKPDITAPGTSLIGPSNVASGYTTKSGTSMAAPIVAGGAALLIDYLKSINQPYTAGTIKAALMQGAQSIGEAIWEEGAGFINLSRSLEFLKQMPLTTNPPEFSYFHPQKLPIDPYEILFKGSSVAFNLSIIQSSNSEITIEVPKAYNQYLNTKNLLNIKNGTKLMEFNFSIPNSAEETIISFNVSIGSTSFPIEFQIREPIHRVLFDESLNRIARHGYGTDAFEIMGDSSSTIGMFSNLTRLLAYENNYSVTPHIKGDLTISKLRNYDCLILANPFSNKSDIYMDWTYNPNNNYLKMSEKTADAIRDYISIGGGVLILNTQNGYFDRVNLNKFLSPFGLQVTSNYISSLIDSEITYLTNFTSNIVKFPFRGNFLQISGSHTSILAEYSGNPTLVSYSNPEGGKILLFGSDIIFDNIGFSPIAYFGDSENNQILAFNSIAWLAEGELKTATPQRTITDPEKLVTFVLIGTIFPLFLIALLYSKRRFAS
ncbi:MAG: hypothetical protein EAX86_02245 [Candidatus Heimdallarchaeota archaeon]|nr:hypothetical protein [Candidatus Heimdallarchaeota archaeon]